MDYEEETRRLTSYLSITITVLGIAGNLLCGHMTMVNPMKHLSTSHLLLGSVISDTVAIVMESLDNLGDFLSLSETEMLYGGHWWRCRITYFFRESSRLVSSWLVVAMSVELFWAKRGEKASRGVYNRQRACYVTLMIYLVSFAACFPLLMVGHIATDNSCTSRYPVFHDLYTALVLPVVVDYLIPLMFILYCAACCVRRTDCSHVFVLNSRSHWQGLQLSTFITVTSLTFVFVCLPHYTLRLMFVIERHQMTALPAGLHFSSSSRVRLAHNIADTIMLLHYGCKFYLAYLLEPDCRTSTHILTKLGRMWSVPFPKLNRQANYLHQSSGHLSSRNSQEMRRF